MISSIHAGQKITSEWDDAEQSIIRVTYRPYWTWEELHEHEEVVLTPMLLASHHPAALILDMRSGPFFDPLDTAQHVQQTGAIHRALPIEMVVFVLRDAAVGMLLKVLHERHGAPDTIYCLARSIGEARAIIQNHRLQTQYDAYLGGE